MPDGGQRLGERISGWFSTQWENLGLKDYFEYELTKYRDWRAIASCADLAAYLDKYDDYRPEAIWFKGRRVGCSSDDIRALIAGEAAERQVDPSTFISTQLQAAFASPAWHELNEVFGATVFDPWLASIVGGEISPDTPEIERVRRFLGTQATFETFGSLLSTLVETVSAGQIENAGRMFTEAKWLLGTCFTSWQSTSPIVQAVILSPLQRLINRTFRETDFTRSQWTDLYALGKISSIRLGQELARLGFSGEKIGWLLDLAERQLSRSDIIALWHKGKYGPIEAASRLKQLGYSRQAVEEIIWLNRKEETSEEKGAYIGTLRKAFKEQLIGEDRLREALRKQGRSDEAIDLEVAVLKLSWEVEAKTAAKSDIRSAYMEDVIGRPEAEHWLKEAGFATHDIQLIVTTWDKQKAPAYRQINKSEILQAWGVGTLTQPEAYQRLRDVGYSERDATVLMETYARTHLAAKPPAVYRLKSSDIMWAWHTEVLEEDDALARLVELGLTEDDAAIVFETFQRLHPRIAVKAPRELLKNDVLEAYGRGILSEDETFAKLVAIGYVETDADVLMRTYEARPEALPPEPSIAQLISATRRGVIDQAVLSQKLTVLGLPAESVQFYVSYAVTPLPERTRALSRTDIMKLWTEGRHDRAWALERLLAMNYSPEDAEDILWLAKPEIEDTETFILWKSGLIDDAIAYAMWSTMGFSAEQIGEYIILE